MRTRPQDVMPVILVAVVITSSIVAVCTLNNALARTRRGGRSSNHLSSTESSEVEQLNGKYRSIEYGHLKLANRLKREGRQPPSSISDENGELLGGKKASLQFGHDLRNKLQAGKDEEPAKSVVYIERAPLNIEDEEGSDKNEVNVEQTGENNKPSRDEVLNKIASFGHFSTTAVKPKNNQPEPAAEELSQQQGSSKESELEKHVPKMKSEEISTDHGVNEGHDEHESAKSKEEETTTQDEKPKAKRRREKKSKKRSPDPFRFYKQDGKDLMSTDSSLDYPDPFRGGEKD